MAEEETARKRREVEEAERKRREAEHEDHEHADGDRDDHEHADGDRDDHEHADGDRNDPEGLAMKGTTTSTWTSTTTTTTTTTTTPHTQAFLRDDARPEVPQRGHHQVALVKATRRHFRPHTASDKGQKHMKLLFLLFHLIIVRLFYNIPRTLMSEVTPIGIDRGYV